jgi:hypothetical protein
VWERWERGESSRDIARSQTSDEDLDGVDVCDLCASEADPSQIDGDGDGLGDACDAYPGDALDDADGARPGRVGSA